MKRVFKNLENHQCIPYAESTDVFIRSLKKYSSRDPVPSVNQKPHLIKLSYRILILPTR